MSGFFICIGYFILIGALVFLLGRLVPSAWFHYDRFPFYPQRFEKNGVIYRKFGVHRWKEKVPDMSIVLPGTIPSRRVSTTLTTPTLARMIQETCIAEMSHALLCVLGFGCIVMWPSVGSVVLALFYALGNIAYCMIQRYNRPKLVRLYHVLAAKQTI